MRTLTEAEWVAEGERRFGPDKMKWRFVCPSCGHVAAIADWKKWKAPVSAAAFSCIGRWKSRPKEAFSGKGPCNYAGGGLIGLNPVHVVVQKDGKDVGYDVFEFEGA